MCEKVQHKGLCLESCASPSLAPFWPLLFTAFPAAPSDIPIVTHEHLTASSCAAIAGMALQHSLRDTHSGIPTPRRSACDNPVLCITLFESYSVFGLCVWGRGCFAGVMQV